MQSDIMIMSLNQYNISNMLVITRMSLQLEVVEASKVNAVK